VLAFHGQHAFALGTLIALPQRDLAVGVTKLLTLAGMVDGMPNVARCAGNNFPSPTPISVFINGSGSLG
jgi:hypothetical protein